MSIVEAVLGFDGTHVGELKAAAETFDKSEAEVLVGFCESETPATRVAATWIVKALNEQGDAAALDMGRVFERLESETDWAVLLHLLQSVQFAPGAASDHRDAIRRVLDHDKTLVRVWALDALARVAVETGDGLGEVRELLETALSATKASERARARNLAPLLGL